MPMKLTPLEGKKVRRVLPLGVVCAHLVFTMPATAEDRVLWHGWMNLTPCSKLITNNGFPYVKTGPQELHGYIKASLPDDTQAEIKGAVGDCAAQAAGTAGAVGLLTNVGAVWPTFMQSFGTCVGSKADGFKTQLYNSVRLETATQCNY
jgi:hypothetical protein